MKGGVISEGAAIMNKRLFSQHFGLHAWLVPAQSFLYLPLGFSQC